MFLSLSSHLWKGIQHPFVILRHLKSRASAFLAVLFPRFSSFRSGIADSNGDGLSDFWEKANNGGELFDANFDPLADPDADRWTNAQEAVAGTDPLKPNPPTGFVQVKITHKPAVYTAPTNGDPPTLITPESFTARWPTVVGKQYTLESSATLDGAAWSKVGIPRLANGTELSIDIAAPLAGGAFPDRLFWRVVIADRDDDFDTLTNYEESIIGSKPYSWDSDGDSIGDTAEYDLYHTSSISRDTDLDGVSDFDEIMRNFMLLCYS
ncbi:MAG: hypothetical protein HC767_02110 [Akkermansiaceae bacterium]|nr:hypothetical protein [Akkermansiaceae bacterium]